MAPNRLPCMKNKWNRLSELELRLCHNNIVNSLSSAYHQRCIKCIEFIRWFDQPISHPSTSLHSFPSSLFQHAHYHSLYSFLQPPLSPCSSMLHPSFSTDQLHPSIYLFHQLSVYLFFQPPLSVCSISLHLVSIRLHPFLSYIVQHPHYHSLILPPTSTFDLLLIASSMLLH